LQQKAQFSVAVWHEKTHGKNLGVAAQRILQQKGEFTVAVWHDLALLLARQRREHFAEGREGRVDVLGLIQ